MKQIAAAAAVSADSTASWDSFMWSPCFFGASARGIHDTQGVHEGDTVRYHVRSIAKKTHPVHQSKY